MAWIMLNDAFISIVKKDCPPGALLCRARREGDLEKVFGAGVKVVRDEAADYLFRAVIPVETIAAAIIERLSSIDYGNYKSSVKDPAFHRALMNVWDAMAALQSPPPYSARRRASAGYELRFEDPVPNGHGGTIRPYDPALDGPRPDDVPPKQPAGKTKPKPKRK
jgi:hypothetical protein